MTVSSNRIKERIKNVLFDYDNMIWHNEAKKTKIVHHLSVKYQISESYIWKLLKDNGK
jgi:predicted transcriptional regulator